MFLWILISTSVKLSAQDIHFSQIEMSPLFENASNAGRYLGSLRVGGIYRQQWSVGNSGKYTSPLFFVDAPLSGGFGEKDWFGLGLMIYQDQSGSVQLSNGGVYAGGAYHLSLDNLRDHVISAGVQIGMAQRRIKNGFEAEFLDEIENVGFVSDDRSLLNNINGNYLDINFGVQGRSKFQDNLEARVGINIRHLNNPNYSLLSDEEINYKKMVILHGRVEYIINSTWSVSPSLYHYRSSSSSASMMAVDGRLLMDQNKQIYLIGGLGTRFGDALIFSVGADYGNLTAKLSYDVTTSDVSTFNGANAIELSAYYTFKLKRKPNIKPVIFCPRF